MRTSWRGGSILAPRASRHSLVSSGPVSVATRTPETPGDCPMLSKPRRLPLSSGLTMLVQTTCIAGEGRVHREACAQSHLQQVGLFSHTLGLPDPASDLAACGEVRVARVWRIRRAGRPALGGTTRPRTPRLGSLRSPQSARRAATPTRAVRLPCSCRRRAFKAKNRCTRWACARS